MRFRNVVINPSQPLNLVAGLSHAYVGGGKRDRPAIHACPRIRAESDASRVSRPAQISHFLQVEIEPWIVREKSAESRDSISRRQRKGEVGCRAERVLLQASENERLVLDDWPTRREAIDIV